MSEAKNTTEKVKKTYEKLSDQDVITKHGFKGLVRNALVLVKAATDFEKMPPAPEGIKRDKVAYYTNLFNQAFRPNTPQGKFGWFFELSDEQVKQVAELIRPFKAHLIAMDEKAAKAVSAGKPLTEKQEADINADIAKRADAILSFVLEMKPERAKGERVKESLAKRFASIEI
jgi:hypothetical protein